MAAPRKIDWERVEPDFRAGVKSVLQIAAEYKKATGVSVTHGAINKHFKALGVTRDLTAKVLAKAKAIVSASMVSGKVSAETTATDSEIINKSAVDIATVQLSHRKDVNDLRSKAVSLSLELNDSGDDLHRRVTILKMLSDTQKTLIGLEREAFGIGAVAQSSSHEDTLDSLA